ncbi:hypothetical protein [Brucella grignonensis]|uniref:Uncharacterized protein n=1 Tax=Brucella grignonensis TaxID=94627 RepID=A0A256F781_9HYPH|nr:hypothetical protein [Brucella grignonensis]OYR10719.1 hypothetical protein CEV33_2184 [Brucella grignonensis]
MRTDEERLADVLQARTAKLERDMMRGKNAHDAKAYQEAKQKLFDDAQANMQRLVNR